MTMMRCSICYLQVGMREDKAHLRVANSEGGWDHTHCRDQTPEQVRLAEIFGTGYAAERRRVAADELGKALGHEI